MEKKVSSSSIAIAISLLSLLLLLLLHHIDAVESDPKGVTTLETNKDPISDSGGVKLPLLDQDKGKKVSEGTEKGELKDDPKGTATKEKNKPLEKPEPKPKEEKGGKESSGAKETRSADGGGEECDPGNRCIDEKSGFVACLRVPGKGSIYSKCF